jgi:hypothetical protein
MAFSDFTFPRVYQDLGLTVDEADFSSGLPSVPLREEFASRIAEGVTLAMAIYTEKARSEFIIAPLLFEVRRRLGGVLALFSGVELNVEPTKGLNGVCDFIFSGSYIQSFLTAPLLTVVEAKNDNLRSGLGQCVASMFAAQLFTQKAESPIDVIHGVVTTGDVWRFLRLEGTNVTLDIHEYFIVDPGKILGVLQSLLEAGAKRPPRA